MSGSPLESSPAGSPRAAEEDASASGAARGPDDAGRRKPKSARGPRKRRPRRRRTKDAEHILERLLEQRPDAQSLVDKNILTPGALGTAPSLLARQLSLRWQQHQRQLERFLRNRHSAQQLRERNILRGPDDSVDHDRHLSFLEQHLSDFLRRRPLPQQLTHSALFKDVLLWSEVPVPTGNRPVARNCHTLCAAPNARRLYLLGGSCVDGLRPELLTFSFSSLRWQKCTCSGEPPPPRYAHSCTEWHGRLFVFGGYGGDRGWLNDLHVLDLESRVWRAPVVRGTPPPPRAAHTATLVGDRVVVIGGNDSRQLFNDVWVLDLAALEWTAPHVSGTPPPVRAGHSAVAHAGQVVVFGGGSGWGAAAHHNDLSVLDTDTMVWYRPSFEGSPPPPRMGHAACVLEGSMFVFGGGDARRVHNDPFALNLETMVWSRPSDAGRLPCARAGHACCALHGQRALTFFGGADMEGTLFSDLHVLELEGLRDTMQTTADAAPAAAAATASGAEATRARPTEASGAAAGAAERVATAAPQPAPAAATHSTPDGEEGEGDLVLAVQQLRRTLRAQMEQHAAELRAVQEQLRRTVATHAEREGAMARQLDALEEALRRQRGAATQ